MEGNVYKTRWEVDGEKYKVYLVDIPNMYATNECIDLAADELCEKICLKYGDGEAILEYENTLPVDDRTEKYSHTEVYSVSGNAGIDKIINLDSCINIRRCKSCQRQRKVRFGEESIVLKYQPKADIAYGFGVKIYSSEFLKNLDQSLLSQYEVREVVSPSRSRKKYFELIGEPLSHFVGVPGFAGLLNSKCEICGICCFTYLQYGELFCFLARDKLPEEIPEFFLIATEHGDHELVMLGSVLAKIKGNKGTRSVVSRRLWVVPDEHYITDNEQEKYPEELYWESMRKS